MKIKMTEALNKRYMNSKRKPEEYDLQVKKGEEVELIADHDNVLIAMTADGKRFTVKKEITNYEKDGH